MARVGTATAATVLAVPVFVFAGGNSVAVARTYTCGGETATIVGTGGQDALVGTPTRDVIVALGGTDSIDALAGDDVLCGGRGVDTIDAGRGADIVWGGADGRARGIEGDLIEGGPGDDTLHGGLDPAESGGVQKNEDIVIYEDAPRGVRINLDEPTVSGQGDDTIDGFYSVVGSEHDDVITAGAETDVVRGLAGADTITVDSEEGEVFGGDGPDVMRLGYYVYGNNGDDDIRFVSQNASGGTGADVMVGTKHHDTYRAGPGRDVIRGRQGRDYLDGEEGSDRIVGGGRDDWVIGGSEEDQLAGGRGEDKLEPGDYAGGSRSVGDDVVRGGAGSDTVDYLEMYRASGVRVDLAEGVATRAGHDLLYSIENASGGAGADELLGSSVRNFLSGGEGDDLLRGRAGRDRLEPDNTEDDFAPLGNDTLHGGLGSDLASYWFARGGRGGVVIDLAAGTATGQGADTLGGIERLQGTSDSDQLLGDAHDNVLRGGLGDDVLVGRRCEDRAIGGYNDDSCDAEQMTGCEA